MDTERIFPIKIESNESIKGDTGYGSAKATFDSITRTSRDYGKKIVNKKRGCRAAGGKDYERNPYRIKASSSEPDFFRIRSSAYGEIKNHEAVEQERTERYIRKQRESGYSCGIELNDCDRDNGKSSSEPCQNPFLLKNPLILGGHISRSDECQTLRTG